MSDTRITRRIARRSLHRSRSAAVIIVLCGFALVAAWIGTESVLAVVGAPPLLVAPSAAVEFLNTDGPVLLAAAIAAVVIGLVLLVVAFSPGRRSRHLLAHERMVVVVDDDVLAGAVGRAARETAAVPASRVRTSVSARRAIVSVVPSSGIPVDSAAVRTSASALLERLAPRPGVRVDVAVSRAGVVGS